MFIMALIPSTSVSDANLTHLTKKTATNSVKLFKYCNHFILYKYSSIR